VGRRRLFVSRTRRETRQGIVTMVIEMVIEGLVLIHIVLGFQQFVGPRCCKYRITDSAIEFVWFGVRAWRCSFEDIRDIEILSFIQMLVLPSLHLMNRPFARHYLLVRRRRGLFRWVLITPDKPNEFLKALRDRILARHRLARAGAN